MPIPYKTSTYKRLVLPWPCRSILHHEPACSRQECSTTRRFGKSACTAFTDSPNIRLTLFVTQPVCSLDLRYYPKNFIDIPYHLSQNYVTFSKNIYLSSYPMVTQDTQLRRHNTVHISERGRCGNQLRILASPFMSSRTGTLHEIRSATCTNRQTVQKLTTDCQ